MLHLQIQMKDFRFSYKFKMACKEDVLRLCPNIKKKSVSGFSLRPISPTPTPERCDLTLSLCRVDVVICLSTTVRNDTLQDAKEQRVSLKCRKQLRVEELEMVAHTPPMLYLTVSLASLAPEIVKKSQTMRVCHNQVTFID